jgi:hypothetical protein
MTHKSFSGVRLFIASFFVFTLAGPLAFADEVTLEDNSVLVSFDSESGALTRMVDKTANWTIERRPELGVSFRLFAPLPNRRWNPVYGQKQRAAEVKKISDNQVELQWKNLNSENGGVLPMTLTATVTLTNGVLTFNSTLKNDSDLTVETIDYPYFGDFNPPSRDSSLNVITLKGGKMRDIQDEEVYPHFANKKGYWGVFYPMKTFDAADSLFCLIQSPTNGVYVGMDNASPKYRLQYTFEQHPGVLSGITQLVPKEDTVPGNDQLFGKEDSNSNKNSMTPVHLEVRTCHFVFAPGHSTTDLAPIVLRCYQGDKGAGENLYKEWRSNL